MKVLITGANGLLGQKLVKLLEGNPEVEVVASGLGTNRNPKGNYSYIQLNITHEDEVMDTITHIKPVVIINTAAMTHVDECELNPETCRKLNVTAVSHLIKAAEINHSFLIHLSTDFVFDGENGPYKEDDLPNPLSKYAESKLASEELLKTSNVRHAIVRTMLVYGVVPDMSRSNIVLWVKKSLEEKKHIKVVNDQWRTPTLAEDLAKGCIMVAEKKAEGIFHISGAELLNPYEMAIETARFFKLDEGLIEETDGSVFTQPARRPAKTGFILDKAKKKLGFSPVSFKEGLAIVKEQLKHA